jgi:Right handed beta helix region
VRAACVCKARPLRGRLAPIGRGLLTGLAVVIAVACAGCATGISGSASTISTTSATVSGAVVSDVGGRVGYWAEYGTTRLYGSKTPVQVTEVAQNTPRPAIVTITGLHRSTLYHYRICAEDSQQRGGPGCGQDQHFTTQTYGCGDTVTTSFKLTGGLDCAQVAGFVVGADGIDINLAGHGMFGSIGSGGGGPTGIDNTGGYDDLTVRNGTVGGFGFGIETKDASRNRILDITAGAAGNAVTIEGGDANEIRHGDLFGRSFGIRVTGSDGLVVADTSSSGAFGDGLNVTGNLARVVRNRFVRTGGEFPIASGIQLVGSGAYIADNLVQGAWSSGGIVTSGSNNVLVDNQVFDATAPAIPDPPPQWGDGIFVGAFSAGAVLRRNRAERNAGDGIDVRATGTRLEDNSAFNNGGWGIIAVSGVVDLGGNSAGGNGAGQCQNVFCP